MAVELDLPTFRHLRSGDGAIPGKSFIIGGISATGSDLPGRERFPSRLLGLPLAVLLTAACASSAPSLTPTETLSPVRSTVTPIPIGGGDSSVCDPQGIIFGKDGKPSSSLTEKIIEEFNACVLTKKAAAEATTTAEARFSTLENLKDLSLKLRNLDLSPEKDGANRNVGDTVRVRILNELSLAQKAYQAGQTSEWQKALNGAEFEFGNWVGPGGRTPPSREEWEKYGSKWARMRGVTPLFQPTYFELVKLMKSLGYWVDETGKDGWR